MFLKKINNQKGFELVDLLFGLAITGIIMILLFGLFLAKSDSDSKQPQTTTQEEKVDEKATTPPKQKEVTKQKGEMNKL